MRRLNLGSGNLPQPNSVNVDLFVWGGGPDVRANAYQLPFSDQTFNWIRSRAMLDHIPTWYHPRVLSECFRVLKIGGSLQIILTDLKLVFQHWLVDEIINETTAIAYLYGGSPSPNCKYLEFQSHRTGFTEERLRRMLEAAGFVEIKRVDVWTTPILELRGRRRD